MRLLIPPFALSILIVMSIQQLFAEAIAHDEHGEWAKAAQLYARCLQIEDHPELHCRLGTCLVRLGDYRRGFAELEWRTGHEGRREILNCDRWFGQPLADKTILLHSQTNIRNVLHFIRYAPFLKEMGAKVAVAVQPALSNFLRGAYGVDQVVVPGDTLDVHFHCPFESLPFMFSTTMADVPNQVPYVHVNRAIIDKWLARMPNGLKVGICWQGSRLYPADAQRSFPLSHFAPLAEIAEVTLISLQHANGVEQLASCDFSVVDLGFESKPFEDAAAIIQGLDLVMSCDTSIAHLAGALGRPVWVALPVAHDWRWLAGRDDSPWYPTMRLFRQTVAGQWSDVFERMAVELREIVSN